MRVVSPQFNTTLSLTEMEALIRRAVKEAVHEEFVRVLRQAPASVAENWTHEGPNDPAADQLAVGRGPIGTRPLSDRFRGVDGLGCVQSRAEGSGGGW